MILRLPGYGSRHILLLLLEWRPRQIHNFAFRQLYGAQNGGKKGAEVIRSVQPLSSFFESESWQSKALDGFFRAWKRSWPLDEELLTLYEASQNAFDSASKPDYAFRSFRIIYEALASNVWNVFRPHSPSDCWPPERIFETIRCEFRELPWHGSVNLLNFRKTGAGRDLKSCLNTMRGIKPKKSYPLMTVSKFLHFYNPSLFPIYDNWMIWEKVLNGRFRAEYQEFCRRENIANNIATGDDTPEWLCHYMNFASSYLSSAHPAFMQVFCDWLARQPGVDLSKRKFGAIDLYATAFEFTISGATNV